MSHWPVENNNKALVERLGEVGNRWARIEVGFRRTLEHMGVHEIQRAKIILDIKNGKFESLDKLLKGSGGDE